MNRDRRGKDGTDAAGALPAFGGIACHDAWAPCGCRDGAAGRALCNAHVPRELVAVTETGTGADVTWARQAIDALPALKKAAGAARAEGLSGAGTEALEEHAGWFRDAAAAGALLNAARRTALQKKRRAPASRMAAREGGYLRFAHDPRVPSDDNEAERVIRMSKLRIRVPGCMRPMNGADDFCAIRSRLATANPPWNRLARSANPGRRGHSPDPPDGISTPAGKRRPPSREPAPTQLPPRVPSHPRASRSDSHRPAGRRANGAKVQPQPRLSDALVRPRGEQRNRRRVGRDGKVVAVVDPGACEVPGAAITAAPSAAGPDPAFAHGTAGLRLRAHSQAAGRVRVPLHSMTADGPVVRAVNDPLVAHADHQPERHPGMKGGHGADPQEEPVADQQVGIRSRHSRRNPLDWHDRHPIILALMSPHDLHHPQQ